MDQAQALSQIEFLLALLSRAYNGDAQGCQESAIEPDWSALVQLALDHGVGGALCDKLCTQAKGRVPDDIRAAAATYLEQARDKNTRSLEVMYELLTELESRQIPTLPFKGPVLALLLYEDLALRSFHDLDFLVQPVHVDAVLEHLGNKGYQESIPQLSRLQLAHYRRKGGQAIFFGPSLPIEPHWEFAPRTLALDIDYTSLWNRVREADLQGRTFRTLDPEDQLILLCLHGGKEGWIKLKWVLDVADFLEKFPGVRWEEICHRARDGGILRMTLLGLVLANRLLGTELPDAVAPWIRRDRSLEGLASLVCRRIFDQNLAPRSVYTLSAFHWNMRERLRDRIRYALRTVTAPRIAHFESLPLPDKLFFLYYGYKPCHDYILLPISKVWKRLRRIDSA